MPSRTSTLLDHNRPRAFTEIPPEPRNRGNSTTRIREELGYAEEVPREEALRRTVAWERAHPPAQPTVPEAEMRTRYAAEDALLAALR